MIFASSILAFPLTMKADVPEGSVLPAGDRPDGDCNVAAQPAVSGLASFSSATSTRQCVTSIPMTSRAALRKYGGFIPGIRPGKRTAEYIDTILTRITLVGRGLPGGRGAAAAVPDQRLQGRADSVYRRDARPFHSAVPHPGHGRARSTSAGRRCSIIVGVAMDTVQQVESQLIMRHYDGFMKKTRIRGREGPVGDTGVAARPGVECRHARPAWRRQGDPGCTFRLVPGVGVRSPPETSCGRRCGEARRWD